MPLPPNFQYIEGFAVAGSGSPVAEGALPQVLDSLRREGIGAIVSLTERPLDAAPIREFEFEYLHVPVEDFTAPTAAQIDRVMAFIEGSLEAGHKVLVHCWAGIGRTGTMLACFLVRRGYKPAEAITRLRRQRPGAVEAYGQEYAVYQYARRWAQEGEADH